MRYTPLLVKDVFNSDKLLLPFENRDNRHNTTMKGNISIILYAIPLTLLIWVGIRFYVNPGKPDAWVPTEIKKVETEKQEEPEETESEEVYVESPQSANDRLLAELRDEKNNDNALKDAELGDSIALKPTQQTVSESSEDKTKKRKSNKEDSQNTDQNQQKSNQQKSNQQVTEQQDPAQQDPAKQEKNDAQPDSESAEQEQAPPNSDTLNGFKQLENLFEENPDQEKTAKESDAPEIDEASNKRNDSNNKATEAEQTLAEENYDSQGQEHGITTIFVSTNEQCANDLEISKTNVKVQYGVETSSIKADSLSELASIIDLYHSCKQSLIVLSHAVTIDPANKSLQRRRLDEVKYHLQHMRVAKTDIVLPE